MILVNAFRRFTTRGVGKTTKGFFGETLNSVSAAASIARVATAGFSVVRALTKKAADKAADGF